MYASNLLTHFSFGISEMLNDNLQMMGPSGLYYDVHNLANLLVAVPIAGVMNLLSLITGKDLDLLGKFSFSLTGIIWCTLSILFYFKTCLLFKVGKKVAYLSSLFLGFSTVVFQYSSLNYEGNLYLFASIGSFYFYKRYFLMKEVKSLFYLGLLLGISANSRDLAGIMILFYSLISLSHFLKKELPLRDFLYFLGGFLPLIFLFSYYNYLRTGSLFKLALIHGLEQKEWGSINPVNPFWEGLMGQLFSPGFSLFIYSPLLAISLVGMFKYKSKFTKESLVLILGTLMATLCVVAKIPNWMGFSGVGNRYTYTLIPLLFLGLPFILEENGVLKKGGLFFGSLGVLLQVSLSSINWKPLLISVMDSTDPHSAWTLEGSVWFLGLKEFFKRLLFIKSDIDLSMLSRASQYTSETFYSWWMRIVPMGGSLWMSLLVGGILLFGIIYFAKKAHKELNCDGVQSLK
ncbi:MAG: hypothetical protein ACJAT2_003072 [Bacteriovoracaceae bacterium]|jgi:hypothetical protein